MLCSRLKDSFIPILPAEVKNMLTKSGERMSAIAGDPAASRNGCVSLVIVD
jgi:hypothetical protein